MTASTLPISRLVNVGVVLTPAGAQAQNLSSLLILGTSTVIDQVQRMRTYTSLAQVATDFGTSAEEYLCAALWFEQTPQPTSLLIGRWCKNNAKEGLAGGVVSAANQLASAWTGITTGAFKITIDGVLESVTALDFHLITNMNGVASVIQTAVAALVPGTTVTWDAVNQRFMLFGTGTTGVSFAVAPGSGVDISHMLAWLSTDGGYVIPYQAAETAIAAVTLFDNQFGQQWYALVIPSAIDADHLAVAPFIEGTTNKHFYGVTTQEAGVLSSVSTTDIAYELQQLNYMRTATQYSSTSAYAIVSALARILTTNYLGNNTVITLMYKQEPGIVPEFLTSTAIAVLEGKNCNVIVVYNNNAAILERGRVASGTPVDVVMFVDWLAVTMQTALFNLLYTAATKVPQTDSGMHLITTTIASVLNQGVADGGIAPGPWNAAGFGEIVQGQFLPGGYYIYAPPLATQNPTDRAARKSVPIQVAVKLAGAVELIQMTVTVNQ